MSENASSADWLDLFSKRVHPIIKPNTLIGMEPDYEVEIKWQAAQGQSGGDVKLAFTNGIISKDDPYAPVADGHVLVSDVQVDQFGDNFRLSNERTRPMVNPLEGTASVFTLIATCNRTAEISGHKFVHLARVNSNSRGFFEKFEEAGLYQLSDRFGNVSEKPVTIFGFRLYRCVYPNDKFASITPKFAVEKAAQELAEINNQICQRIGEFQ